MGVSLPYPVEHDVDVTSLPTITVGSVGPVGPVVVDGIPDSYDIDVNVTHIPKIELGIDPLTINPLDVSLRLKEIPSVRAHVPINYCMGLSLLGIELANIRLCGESQVITEPYRPNPCEICGHGRNLDTINPTHRGETAKGIKGD